MWGENGRVGILAVPFKWWDPGGHLLCIIKWIFAPKNFLEEWMKIEILTSWDRKKVSSVEKGNLSLECPCPPQNKTINPVFIEPLFLREFLHKIQKSNCWVSEKEKLIDNSHLVLTILSCNPAFLLVPPCARVLFPQNDAQQFLLAQNLDDSRRFSRSIC